MKSHKNLKKGQKEETDTVHVRESFVTGKLKIKDDNANVIKEQNDRLAGGANNVHYESDGSEVTITVPSVSKKSPGKSSKLPDSTQNKKLSKKRHK